MKFDKDFEEDVLACCLSDTAYLKAASRLLDSHHFHSPQHGWIWKQLKDIFKIYRERATAKLVLARAKTEYKDEDERKAVIELTAKLIRHKPTTGKATLAELHRFVKFVNAQAAMEEGARALDDNNVDKAYDALLRCVRNDIAPRTYSHAPWFESYEERQGQRKYRKEHPEEFPRVSTGIKMLDRILSGGLESQEIGMVLGTTGKGKSILLTNMCHAAVAHGIPSVYFAMEMSMEQVAMRQDARFLGVSYRKLKEYDWKPSELRQIAEKRERMKEKLKNMLHIVSMPVRKCTIDTVRSCLEDLKAGHDGFVPKAIYLDSADHMNPVGMSPRESFRLQQSAVYWEVKQLATEEGYAIWTSTHAGREWSEKTAEAEAAGESYDKSRIVDAVLSINTPTRKSRATVIKDDDDGEGETVTVEPKTKGQAMELRLSKYRDGKSKVSIKIDSDFDIMTIREIEEAERAVKVAEEE